MYVEGYIVFAFPFIFSHVCSSFRHIPGTRVKVFASKFIRPYIIWILSWILFIFGIMVDIGLKVYSVASQPQGLTLRSRSQNFHIKVKIFAR